MEVVQVYAGPHDLNKLRKRVTSYGQSSLVGCQVAGNDVRGTWCYCTEISAAGLMTAGWPKYGFWPGRN